MRHPASGDVSSVVRLGDDVSSALAATARSPKDRGQSACPAQPATAARCPANTALTGSACHGPAGGPFLHAPPSIDRGCASTPRRGDVGVLGGEAAREEAACAARVLEGRLEERGDGRG